LPGFCDLDGSWSIQRLNAIGKATAARTRQRKAGESGRRAVALHFMNGKTQELYQAA
jgi:hypothetical protein